MITAHIGREHYATTIYNTENRVVVDEPAEKGGLNTGLAPSELLAGSLASCTCITLRMYADRKGWDLEAVTVTVSPENEDGQTVFRKAIVLKGNLDGAQIARLLFIADKCPVHKMLTQPISILTNSRYDHGNNTGK